jgi:ubiquinone/menaquinone biosynthesis C-methylase UbiE
MVIMQDINTIKKNKIRILDVGSGGEGIAEFLKYSTDFEKYDICLADIDKEKIKNVNLGKPLVADGKKLPLKNSSFDIVVSVDTLEHIPKKNRREFLEELKRVSNKYVLLHAIINDPEKGFVGKSTDLEFQKYYLKKFRKPEPNTCEHLKSGYPTINEVINVFPNSKIKGTQNSSAWLKYMLFSQKPLIGFFSGLLYLLKWKKMEKCSPYHACFFKWPNKLDKD